MEAHHDPAPILGTLTAGQRAEILGWTCCLAERTQRGRMLTIAGPRDQVEKAFAGLEMKMSQEMEAWHLQWSCLAEADPYESGAQGSGGKWHARCSVEGVLLVKGWSRSLCTTDDRGVAPRVRGLAGGCGPISGTRN